jgi:putative ribosome biogenesis GTPase RsgA
VPATSIETIYEYLSPTPLMTREDLDKFYSPRVNKVRGQDVVARLKLALGRSAGKDYYKAFLVGHSGVGKSTELTRLIYDVD